jgi:hypothetical protein
MQKMVILAWVERCIRRTFTVEIARGMDLRYVYGNKERSRDQS